MSSRGLLTCWSCRLSFWRVRWSISGTYLNGMVLLQAATLLHWTCNRKTDHAACCTFVQRNVAPLLTCGPQVLSYVQFTTADQDPCAQSITCLGYLQSHGSKVAAQAMQDKDNVKLDAPTSRLACCQRGPTLIVPFAKASVRALFTASNPLMEPI